MSEPLLISRGPLLNFSGGGFWAPHPHRLELVYYRAVEYRFQAMKSLYMARWSEGERTSPDQVHDEIVSAADCFAAKRMGSSIPLDVMRWDQHSPRYMLEAMLLKFTQNPDTLQFLLDTGDRSIVEHRPDPVWGDNMDGSGRNLVGLALEHVRDKLR